MTCVLEPTLCTSCNTEDGEFLSEGRCLNSTTLADKCVKYMIGGGCAICHDGFYNNDRACAECMDECRTCSDGASCSLCSSAFFMSNDGMCKDKSDVVGCAVEVDSDFGCTKCKDGYFLLDRECFACVSVFVDCTTCTEDVCTGCANGKILLNGVCASLSEIKHCTKASMSKCSACTFWRQPSADGMACVNRPVWWDILIAV